MLLVSKVCDMPDDDTTHEFPHSQLRTTDRQTTNVVCRVGPPCFKPVKECSALSLSDQFASPTNILLAVTAKISLNVGN